VDKKLTSARAKKEERKRRSLFGEEGPRKEKLIKKREILGFSPPQRKGTRKRLLLRGKGKTWRIAKL